MRGLLLALAVALTLAAPARAQVPARHVEEQAVYEIASQLRCVVCQNLSVADSPSEMAGQMRAVVRERLAAGDTPDQVRQYFVDRYGEWILLAPRREGFTLLVWVFPIVAVAVGLGSAYFEAVDKFMNPRLDVPGGDRIVSLLNRDAKASRVESRALYDFAIWRAQLETVQDLGAAGTFVRNSA